MTTVRQEFETRVAAFAAAQVPPLLVSYENIPFTRPTNTPWLECYIAPATTVSATLDTSTNRERGTLGITVWVPSGKGVTKADEIAAKIVKAFPVLPKVGVLSVEQPVNTSRFILADDGWGAIACSCPYRVESVA